MKNACFIPFVLVFLLTGHLWGQNAPVTRAGTWVTAGPIITLPVTASGFNDISSCNLTLHYDPAVATATAVTAGPLMGGTLSADLSEQGTIALGWYTYPALTLAGEPVLFNITFERTGTGVSPVTWFDDGYSCVYYDSAQQVLNDLPAETYYLPGSIEFLDTTNLGISTGNNEESYPGLNCFPNPFSGAIQIAYNLPEAGNVTIDLINMTGAIAKVMVNRANEKGSHTLNSNIQGIPPGVYILRISLTTENKAVMKCIRIIKNP